MNGLAHRSLLIEDASEGGSQIACLTSTEVGWAAVILDRRVERFARAPPAFDTRGRADACAPLVRCSPGFGQDQTRIGRVEIQDVTDTTTAQVDSVDAFGEFSC
jgi:hypothetical protein